MDAALRMGEHGIGQGMAGLALVQSALTPSPERRVFQPIDHEQGPFDPANLAKHQVQAILLAIGTEFPEHVRGANGTGLDGRSEAQ